MVTGMLMAISSDSLTRNGVVTPLAHILVNMKYPLDFDQLMHKIDELVG